MDSNSLDPEGADYKRLVTSLREMGLITSAKPQIEMLTGGVSSLIVLVQDGDAKFCAKSALAKLKVAEDWHAPVHRSQAEVAWMRTACTIAPNNVPKILGEDTHQNIFAMEWLDPADHPVWKQQLLNGEVDPDTARDMGDVLGKVHKATAGDGDIIAQFPNAADFDALRLDPYLRSTAKAHPDLAQRLTTVLDATACTRHALIHGDVSPKNVLIGLKGPIILDAECATYGDPAFDLAFCLNHLILKAVHLPDHVAELATSYTNMVNAYLSHVTWEPVANLEARTAALLPCLALARVDGKSPLEYLAAENQSRVRNMTRPLITSPTGTLDQFLTHWMESLS